MTDPATIAASLTKAQRRAFDLFKPGEVVGLFPINIAKQSRNRIEAMGLIEVAHRPAFGLVTYRLSPLGLSVRAHLEKSNAE